MPGTPMMGPGPAEVAAPVADAAGAGPGFFDDDYYRILAPFHSERDARREVAALRELLGLSQSDRILDLGCGWGRHLDLLADAGHDALGIDRSLPLLRRGASDAPVAAADMRRLPFPDARFDVVLNLATSLGLFLDDPAAVRALAEARRVLRPRGRLLIEGMHRDDIVARYAHRDRWTLDDGTLVRARRRFDPVTGVSHEVLRWVGTDGRPRTKRHSLRLRSATELVRILQGAGLTLRAAFGDWHGDPLRAESPRCILIASPAPLGDGN
jgi:SAM-dependent methyltransferase